MLPRACCSREIALADSQRRSSAFRACCCRSSQNLVVSAALLRFGMLHLHLCAVAGLHAYHQHVVPFVVVGFGEEVSPELFRVGEWRDTISQVRSYTRIRTRPTTYAGSVSDFVFILNACPVLTFLTEAECAHARTGRTPPHASHSARSPCQAHRRLRSTLAAA